MTIGEPRSPTAGRCWLDRAIEVLGWIGDDDQPAHSNVDMAWQARELVDDLRAFRSEADIPRPETSDLTTRLRDEVDPEELQRLAVKAADLIDDLRDSPRPEERELSHARNDLTVALRGFAQAEPGWGFQSERNLVARALVALADHGSEG